MHPLIIVAGLAAAEPIIVTGSREPLAQANAPAATTLVESRALEALALPGASDVLRLLPGVSVSVSGPRGSQTQVRLRGAEANHTLLFVDGIRFNDPAAGNEARFELLNTDLLSRIELVPGAQSALWGPEALGGVVSVETADPFARQGFAALGEYGSQDSLRGAAQAAVRTGQVGLSATASWLRGDGIDSFGANGERDGFESRSLGLRAAWRPATGSEFGVTGLYLSGTSEYDGFDPVTFRRADTLDETANRIAAVRGWGSLTRGGWTLSADASLLDSANRNRLADAPLNRTAGRRFASGAQLSRQIGGHRITAAVEHEAEDFRARDQIYFGGTDQDRGRSLNSAVVEWRGAWSDMVVTSLAVRHDSFTAFRDATSLRATAMVKPSGQWTLIATYGEGVAQPTFYDLFGFFPGSFAGNPGLKPESSRGWEAVVAWRRGPAGLRLAAFTNRLESEIVDVFDPLSFQSSTRNVDGESRRRGVELSGQYRISQALEFHANYTFLDASERPEPTDAAIREVRRPRHSANFIAFGEAGRLSWSGTLAIVGARQDTNFEIFPAARVRLGAYALGSARIGWRLTDALEAYVRGENLLDDRYEDVLGYATPGRTVHAGFRLRLGS